LNVHIGILFEVYIKTRTDQKRKEERLKNIRNLIYLAEVEGLYIYIFEILSPQIHNLL